MTDNYPTGTVALIRVSDDYSPEIGIKGGNQWYVAGPRLGSRHGWHNVRVVRLLVVIDPEDREQVERLTGILIDAMHGWPEPKGLSPSLVADALRSLIAPPKPEEPTGLGAVVEDAEGNLWVQVYEKGLWQRSDDRDVWTVWEKFSAVRVLSEGVQPERESALQALAPDRYDAEDF